MVVGCWKRLVIRSTPVVMIDLRGPSTLASAQAASMHSDSMTFDPNLELQIEKSEEIGTPACRYIARPGKSAPNPKAIMSRHLATIFV